MSHAQRLRQEARSIIYHFVMLEPWGNERLREEHRYMFNRAFARIGITVLVMFTLIVSLTNTWKFINEFLPPDPFWLRLSGYVFFEGGVIVWSHLLKHTTENVHRTIIAFLMTIVSLVSVLTATGYEVGKDVHSLGFTLPPIVLAWVPLCVLLVIGSQIITVLLYYFSDPEFFARLSHLNTHGTTPHVGVVRVQQQNTVNAAHYPPQQGGIFNKLLRGIAGTLQAFGEQLDNKSLIAQKSSISDGISEGVSGDENDEDNDELEGEEEGTETPANFSQSRASMPRNNARMKRAKYRTYEQSFESLAMFVERYPNITDADLAEKVGCSVNTVRRWRREQ